jgi:sortase B
LKINFYSLFFNFSKIKNIDTIITNNTTNSNIIETLRREYDNQDITGILYIPNTSIKEPILQTSNNYYYLSHSPSQEYFQYGSIYMDYRTNPNNSRKLLIYGHSSIHKSLDIVPFNELEEYYSKDYYDTHKYITLILENETREYEIFSIYVETSDFTYLDLNFTSNNSWYSHLIELKSKSFYETEVEINPDEEILILQTCSTNKKYSSYSEKYLLIISKRI